MVRDVAATTRLRIEMSTWIALEIGIGAVLYEAGARPNAPVWEAAECLDGGDSLALHLTGTTKPFGMTGCRGVGLSSIRSLPDGGSETSLLSRGSTWPSIRAKTDWLSPSEASPRGSSVYEARESRPTRVGCPEEMWIW